ncbi:MAG: hypothetical protein IPH68_15650 [Chitinophagaceae bacterium]|nr:hypothetical protein [Chitinophagaceae bacterium]
MENDRVKYAEGFISENGRDQQFRRIYKRKYLTVKIQLFQMACPPLYKCKAQPFTLNSKPGSTTISGNKTPAHGDFSLYFKAVLLADAVYSFIYTLYFFTPQNWIAIPVLFCPGRFNSRHWF